MAIPGPLKSKMEKHAQVHVQFYTETSMHIGEFPFGKKKKKQRCLCVDLLEYILLSNFISYEITM